MKKKYSVILLLLLLILSIILVNITTEIYWSIAFDAADGNWTFAHYYLSVYKQEILLMILSISALLLSVLIKNSLNNVKNRPLVIGMNTIIKGIIILEIMNAISSINTLVYLNDRRAHLSISMFISIGLIVVILLVLITLVFETIAVLKKSMNKQ